MKSVAWFPAPPPPRPSGGLLGSLAKLGITALAGLVLRRAGHPVAAYVAWGLGGALGGASLVSARARHAIDAAFARIGRGLGTVLGTVLLGAIYLLVVTPLRVVRRALGADDLHLRTRSGPSYWLPSDDDARKVRWAGAMFATELRARGTKPLRTALVAFAALFLLSEGILRTQGFGHTVLYVADPDAGYYPQPNVDIVRYGGRVTTNEYGMRSPPISKKKPDGVFRILMLGDSTLWGGSYIDQEELYASIVRNHLNALGLPGRVEVLVMGVNGWGPFHERGFVKLFGTMDSDLTVVHLPIDDVNRPLYGLMSVPFFAAQAPPRLALEEVANHLMWRYRSEHAGLDAKWEAQQARHGIEEYGRLADDLLRLGSEVMFFVLPERDPGFGRDEEEDHRVWRESLERTVAQRSIKSYFARGHFTGKGEPDAIYHDNVHLSPLGHRLYADFVEARITADSERFRAFAARRPQIRKAASER